MDISTIWPGWWRKAAGEPIEPKSLAAMAYDIEVTAAGWRPIVSAPRDGSWIWVLSPASTKRDFERISAFKYDERNKTHECHWFAGNGWWPSINHMYTHWAPITQQPPSVPVAKVAVPTHKKRC